MYNDNEKVKRRPDGQATRMKAPAAAFLHVHCGTHPAP